MNSRRLACFLIGLWLGGSLLVDWSAAHSFRTAREILTQPGLDASRQIKTLGVEEARKLLRYQASELNRSAFELWEVIQIVFGSGFFFYILFGTKEGKFPLGMVLLMLTVVLVQRFLLTPELTAVGRSLDYMDVNAGVGQRRQFWILHGAYSVLEMLKIAVGLVFCGKLAFGRSRLSDARKQVNPVDKRNYGHVNR